MHWTTVLFQKYSNKKSSVSDDYIQHFYQHFSLLQLSSCCKTNKAPLDEFSYRLKDLDEYSFCTHE